MGDYTLYTPAPGLPAVKGTIGYRHGDWIVTVRANSQARARELLTRQEPGIGKLEGIIKIDRSSGPGQWTWELDEATYAPQWR